MTAPGHGGAASFVLVPLDGAIASRSALPVAHTLARHLGATVHVLHASDPALPAAEIGRRFGNGAVEVVHAAAGDPAAAILAAARGGAPVVMTPHAGHPGAMGLGPVAARVLAGAEGPVVLVPPERGEVAWEPRGVVAPLDGAPGSGAAVTTVHDLVRDTGARLTLLHVVDAGLHRPRVPGSYAAPRYVDRPHHDWPAWCAEVVDRSGARGLDHVRVRVATGHPGPTILRAAGAEAADLVVLAWTGVLDERADTLRAILAGARCPVMVVRAGVPVA